VELRQQLALADKTDLCGTFDGTLTPHFFMALVADLRAAGWLTDQELHQIEEQILGVTDRDGQWLNYLAFKGKGVCYESQTRP
jgi:hypothetical protein